MAAKNAIPAGMYRCKWRDSETLKKEKREHLLKSSPLSYLNVSFLIYELCPVPSPDIGSSRMSYGCKALQFSIGFMLLNHTVGFQIPPLC